MEVREGYKKSKLGMIPKDWTECSIGELIKFQGGSQPDKSYFLPVPKEGYIRLIQIRDYKTNKYRTYVPEKLARRFCNKDDIMIGRYGPPVFQILKGISGAYNVALIKAIPDKSINKNYAYYFLKQENLFSFIDKLSQRSSGQTGVDLEELRKYPLPLPSTKTEQKAIANVLSDTDTLIQSITSLIAKKQKIKQGAMQNLLSPYYRNGKLKKGWKAKKIGSFTTATAGGTPSTLIDDYWNGDIKWMSSGELNNKKIYNTVGRISTYGLDNSSTKIIPKKCVLIGLAGQGKTRGTAAINYVELCTNQSIAAIYPSSTISNEFLYYNLDGRYDELRNLSTGDSGRGGLNLTIIKNMNVWMPECIKEQVNIATVLSDMDNEIAVLETKLTKYQNIKQGMMQNLLTGRIRLV